VLSELICVIRIKFRGQKLSFSLFANAPNENIALALVDKHAADDNGDGGSATAVTKSSDPPA